MFIKSKKYIFNIEKDKSIYRQNGFKIFSVTTDREFKDFFKVPWYVYKDDKNWIAPFWIEYKDFFKKENPFWKHAEIILFLAKKNDNNIGRIASIIDHNLMDTTGEKIGYFGFFECIEDYTVANELFNLSKQWLKLKGMTIMRGPIDGRVDLKFGFLYEGFNSPPTLLSPYSPKYYLDFVKKFGMKKCRDQLSFIFDLLKPFPKYLKTSDERCQEKGIKVRNFNRLHAGREMNLWIDMMLNVFSEHWGYVPISHDEIKERFGVKQARWFIESGLFLIAEIENKPIAFLWATPDYNQAFNNIKGDFGLLGILKFLWFKRKINLGKLNLLGIKKEYRGLGIGSCLNYNVLLEMKKRGYKSAEIGWIDEYNKPALVTLKKTGAKSFKKFRVFEKKINH